MLDDMRLVDEFMNVYHCAGRIGAGGQGVVLRARDSDIALKLLLDGAGEPLADPQARAAALARLQRLRVLPLPPGLTMAGPVAALRDQAGYVMRLLDGMRSFEDVFGSPCDALADDAVPAWLGLVHSQDPRAAAQLADYAATGSSRVRLLQLARCAAVLARLHAAGLVYGDLSPSNVFTSGAQADGQVWLIDADNVHFDGDPAAANAFITPGYGAPELVRGEAPPSLATDCHAFAVLAFKLLCLAHPFIGRQVKEGGWDSDRNPQQQAARGELPWIYDADDSNRGNDGLPPALACGTPLLQLFQECFSAGRLAPWRRPAMAHWPAALSASADRSIDCGGCGMSWFALEEAACPYCRQARPRLLRLENRRWPGGHAPDWTLLLPLDSLESPVTLPARLFQPFSPAGFDEPVLSLQAEEGGYRLRRVGAAGPLLRIARAGAHGGRFEALENFHLDAAALAGEVAILATGAPARMVWLDVMEAM
jgi:hypothetical protein